MGLQILVYLDAQAEARRRRDLANIAAVIVDSLTEGGIGIGLRDAWPEFFVLKDDVAFPQVGADMSDFTWERPTPESYESDLKAMMEASEHISIPETPDPLPRMPVSGSGDLEWT